MQFVARVAVVILIAAISPRGALANCDDEAHREGLELRRRGDHVRAQALFEALWREHHEQCALARMALAEAELLRLVEAEEHLRAALDEARDPWIAANRAALQRFLDEQIVPRLGTLTVSSATPHAELWINGAAAGALNPSVTRRVSVGDVRFEVRAPGHVSRMSAVTVASRETVVERIDLERSSRAAREAPRPAAVLSPLVWVGGGVALAAAATAVVLGVRGDDLVADYDARCVDREPAVGTDCQALRRDTQTSLDGSAVAVNVLWGVSVLGAATAAVGVYLSLRRPTPASDAQTARVGVVAGPRGAGLSVRW